MYLNKAIVVGNLTRDPEERALPSGGKVTTFSVATNRVYINKEGQKQEDTQYHNIVVFGRQAETSAQYLKKGQQVMIEGRMQTRSWDDQQSGKKLYRTEIVADRVQFGSKVGGAGSAGGFTPAQGQDNGSADDQSAPSDGGSQIDYPEEEINPDDIPF